MGKIETQGNQQQLQIIALVGQSAGMADALGLHGLAVFLRQIIGAE